MPVSSALARIIAEEIQASGPMPFYRFMQLALYHPEHGYYAAGKARIGRSGDFFTNVSIGPLFGHLIGLQFEQMWERLGNPSKFTVVEQGANNGDFARDFLASVAKRNSAFAAAVEYRIVEPLNEQRKRQRYALADFDRVAFHPSLEDLPKFTGVHFSNELIDAFPVHRLRSNGIRWFDQCVEVDKDRMNFVGGPPSALAILPERRPAGFQTEICPDASGWIRSVSKRLNHGFILLIDYGYPRAMYYASERSDGTLSAYLHHRRISDPLEQPGETDLTAHVEFTSLAESALDEGLELAGFTDQHHFMVGLGQMAFPDCISAPSPEQQQERRAFAMLMHPGLMGQSFKVLCVSRGVAEMSPLVGFRFSQEPASALGLNQALLNRLTEKPRTC